MESVIKNGSVPKRDKTIQKQTTIRTPSLSLKSFLTSLKGHQRISPPRTVKANEYRQGDRYSPSAYIKSTN